MENSETKPKTLKMNRSKATMMLIGIIALQAIVLAYSSARHSPTWDEVGHLGAGVSHWEFGEFSQYAVNPPLVRTIAAMPVALFMEPNLDWRDLVSIPRHRTEVQVGRRLTENNPDRFLWFFTVARWMCMPFAVVGTVVCFLWGRDLFGTGAGLMAAGTWALSPMVLGHGALITPDVAAASMGIAAFYCFRRWLLDSTWANVLLMSVFFSLALLTKSTWILSLAIVPMVWMLWRLSQPSGEPAEPRRWGRDIVQMVSSVVLVFVLVNTFYGFEGTFTRLGEYDFVSQELAGREIKNRVTESDNRFRGTWLAELPIPLPANFLSGMDLQKYDFSLATRGRGWPSYMFGESRVGGWWYYYLAGFAVKEPLAWLLLLLASIPLVALKRLPGTAIREWGLLWVPTMVLLVAVSSQTGLSRHLRYALPALPFLFIWTSQFAIVFTRQNRLASAAMLLLIGWFVGSSLYYTPHQLAYFNELVGGPYGGHRALGDSNLDWGQDLIYLKEWQDAHPEVTDLRIAYFGCFDPRLMGFKFEIPSPYFPLPDNRHFKSYLGPQTGWFAVSANYALGTTMPVPNGHGKFVFFPNSPFAYFNRFEPVDRAGTSIWIYHLEPEEVARVRKEMGIPLQGQG